MGRKKGEERKVFKNSNHKHKMTYTIELNSVK